MSSFDYDRLAASLDRARELQKSTRLAIVPNAVQEVLPKNTPSVRLECRTPTGFRCLRLTNHGQTERYWLTRAKASFQLAGIAFSKKGAARQNSSSVSWVGHCDGAKIMITAKWVN
jgi:hypothetical protein